MSAATIHDVARHAGVSPATVSRVYSGRAVVAEETRRRVLAAAEELQFSPNRMAAGLRRGRTNAISLIMPFNTPELMDAAQQAANARGFTLMVHCTFQPDVAAEVHALKMALDHQVAGLIWQPTGVCGDYASILPRLKRAASRVILLERGADILPEADLLYHDTEQAARDAVAHLRERGYRSLLHLSQDDGYRLRGQRRAEFQRAAGEDAAAITCSPEQVRDALETALRDAREPVGLYIDSDWMAFAAVQAIEALGYAIPRDVGLVILGDMLIGGRFRSGEIAQPSLTAMQRQQAQLARRCVERVFHAAEASDDEPSAEPAPLRLGVPLPLIARQSTHRQPAKAGASRLGSPGGQTLSHPFPGDR